MKLETRVILDNANKMMESHYYIKMIKIANFNFRNITQFLISIVVSSYYFLKINVIRMFFITFSLLK